MAKARPDVGRSRAGRPRVDADCVGRPARRGAALPARRRRRTCPDDRLVAARTPGRAGRRPARAVPRPHRGGAGRRHRQRQVQPVQRARPAATCPRSASAGPPPARRTPASGARRTAPAALLDWLGVLPRHRFARESALDGDDEAGLRGLVLLDLPDFDSVERTHRLEVDRLLGLVDLMVWVVDPQKYADRVLHDGYLRQFRRHRDVTVVVLNQADRLAPADADRVPGRPAPAARPTTGSPGCRCWPPPPTEPDGAGRAARAAGAHRRRAAGRAAPARRRRGERWRPAWPSWSGRRCAEDAVDRGTVRALTDALAAAAGYRRWPRPPSGRTGTGRRPASAGRRPAGCAGCARDPLRRLRLGPTRPCRVRPGADPPGRTAWDSWSARDVPPPAAIPAMAAQPSAVSLAVRRSPSGPVSSCPTPGRRR